MVLTAAQACSIVRYRPVSRILKQIKQAAKDGYTSEAFHLSSIQLELIQELGYFVSLRSHDLYLVKWDL